MWQVKWAMLLGAIIIGVVGVAIGSITIMQPIHHQKPVKRKKQENDEQSDTRSGFYSAFDPIVSVRSDDEEYYSADELEEELDLMSHLHNLDKNFGLDNESLLEESFIKLKDFQEKFPNNCEVLWRLAKCCHFLSTYFEEQKRRWITEGCMYASQALKIKKTADTLQWFAMLEGRKCLFCSFTDKIKFAKIFKQHIVEAISLRPQDAFLHYLLANFYFQTVHNVPSFLKKIAESIVGIGTIEDAVYYSVRAEELSSRPMKQNKLLLAKCLLHKDNKVNKPQVLNLLYEASCIEVITPEDKEAHEEILTLEASLK